MVSKKDKLLLESLGPRDATDDEVAAVREIFIRTGAKAKVEAEIESQLGVALKTADGLDIDVEYSTELRTFAESLLKRTM